MGRAGRESSVALDSLAGSVAYFVNRELTYSRVTAAGRTLCFAVHGARTLGLDRSTMAVTLLSSVYLLQLLFILFHVAVVTQGSALPDTPPGTLNCQNTDDHRSQRRPSLIIPHVFQSKSNLHANLKHFSPVFCFH